jgi:hypothetical protein
MVRSARTFERYSRGFQVVRAIHELWDLNADELDNTRANQRIQKLAVEYDLTVDEWHYWCRIAATAENRLVPQT